MKNHTIPAAFMRGGTSKALMFHLRDLPTERAKWDRIFLAAMGSPDPYGRQLDGMGGGVSSVSKVCIIAPSARDDADVDYTFGQVLIKEPRVDYAGRGMPSTLWCWTIAPHPQPGDRRLRRHR